MSQEFQISLADRPGELAKVSAILGDEGVNIEGLTVMQSGKPNCDFHFVTNNDEAAKAALEKAGVSYAQNDVLMLKLENKPGVLATFGGKLGAVGVNMTVVYVTMHGQQVVGVDNIDEAKKIANDLGVLV